MTRDYSLAKVTHHKTNRNFQHVMNSKRLVGFLRWKWTEIYWKFRIEIQEGCWDWRNHDRSYPQRDDISMSVKRVWELLRGRRLETSTSKMNSWEKPFLRGSRKKRWLKDTKKKKIRLRARKRTIVAHGLGCPSLCYTLSLISQGFQWVREHCSSLISACIGGSCCQRSKQNLHWEKASVFYCELWKYSFEIR